MTDPSRAIWFFPSFASSYSYIAAQRIEDVAARHGRVVLWRPVLMRRLLAEQHGGVVPDRSAERMAYHLRDVVRIANARGLPLVVPSRIPADSDVSYAMVYALAGGDEARLRALTLAVLQAVWASGKPVRDAAEMSTALARYLLGRAEVELAACDPAGVAGHDAALAEARRTGMCGAPWMVVEGETFWGQDRIVWLDRWLGARPRPPADKAVAD